MYSKNWFDSFLTGYPAEKTAREIDFIRKIIPPSEHKKILDLCCGNGRHLAYLQDIYSEITGMDISDYALQKAAAGIKENVRLVKADMRRLAECKDRFDAVVNLWQSFGYYSGPENESILRNIRSILLPDGIFLLDIYNLEFMELHTGQRTIRQNGRDLSEESSLDGCRLTVKLMYPGSPDCDVFEWQLFSPESISGLLLKTGFRDIRICSDFTAGRKPTRNDYKMQVACRK